jgi:hypothetical protein
MVATIGLIVLGGVLFYTVWHAGAYSKTRQIIALVVLIAGVLLFVASGVTALHFRKRARIAQKGEQDGE